MSATRCHAVCAKLSHRCAAECQGDGSAEARKAVETAMFHPSADSLWSKAFDLPLTEALSYIDAMDLDFESVSDKVDLQGTARWSLIVCSGASRPRTKQFFVRARNTVVGGSLGGNNRGPSLGSSSHETRQFGQDAAHSGSATAACVTTGGDSDRSRGGVSALLSE